ncbi:MAG TPA: hypothetical protein PKA27_14775, partial [Fimbriimonadaceae bacterium]|nr:hypothetical protein [Fimbriimonadaceae bacterium]
MSGLQYLQEQKMLGFRDATGLVFNVDLDNRRVGVGSTGQWALAVFANADDGGASIRSNTQALRVSSYGESDTALVERHGTGNGLTVRMNGPSNKSGLYVLAQDSEGINVLGGSASALGYLSRITATSPVSGGLSVTSIGGAAVKGTNNGTTGTTYGGFFSSSNPTGYGIQGQGTTGRGVFGWATSATAGATPYGVRGTCSTATNGFGLYAGGDSGASGTKSFRIDHPHDPENKFLLHYSSESPFPQN